MSWNLFNAVVRRAGTTPEKDVDPHVDALVTMPWRIDQDNDNGLCVVDARGVTVYVEDWGGIPDEMSSGMRSRIIEQGRANPRFMVAVSVAFATND